MWVITFRLHRSGMLKAGDLGDRKTGRRMSASRSGFEDSASFAADAVRGGRVSFPVAQPPVALICTHGERRRAARGTWRAVVPGSRSACPFPAEFARVGFRGSSTGRLDRRAAAETVRGRLALARRGYATRTDHQRGTAGFFQRPG